MTESMNEYRAVRETAGLLDRAECDLLAITGADRLTWLQGMVSNDVSSLGAEGRERVQAFLLSATGHVLCDVSLIHVSDPEFCRTVGLSMDDCVLLDVPAGQGGRVASLLDRYIVTEDVQIHDLSQAACCLSIQGPKAAEVWAEAERRLPEAYVVVPANHAGSGGLDVFVPEALDSAAREAILAVGAVEVVPSIAEVLRVEAGIPKYPDDVDENVLAPEAGMNATHISLTKGCYIGQEIVARIDARGHTNRALTGLVVAEGSLPKRGDRIFTVETPQEMIPREVGRITSIVPASPAVGGRPLALGYVRHEARAHGTPLQISDEVVGTVSLIVVNLPLFGKAAA